MNCAIPWPLRAPFTAALAATLVGLCSVPALAQGGAPQHLRIVGGVAGVNQYTRHEEPFWTTELPRLSGGKVSAEIVPFDRAGIRGQEMLRLIQLGVVPFGTALLSVTAAQDPELSAPDLAGLTPDMKGLSRVTAAFRPYLDKTLRERYGIELLAVYVYPAQVAFCNKPFTGLAGLSGRRVRTSNASQSDLVEALGAIPVQTGFADILPNLRSGNIDCAITGTMSGNTIGLHEVTTHVHSMALNWGLSVFGANQAAWNALTPQAQALLRRELPKLERAIWDESERETSEGIACNIGAASCTVGRKGRMIEVTPTADDQRRLREIVTMTVLPRWLQRCGPQCAQFWNQTIAPVVGFEARP
jgi:TRAP-type C4-dicarboxylate transport system substrate-binding protein